MSAAQLTKQICCGLLTSAASVEVGKPFSLWLPDARACEDRLSEVESAIRKIDLRELTCQYPSHIKPGAK